MDKNFCAKEYAVRLVTPAFSGGADQSAQWRVPPFKALLRQWWRVVWWNTRRQPTLANLHRQESELFGAATEAAKSASRVRIRLDRWRTSALGKSEFGQFQFAKMKHPEVGPPVAVDLYLGYGPLNYSKAAHKAELSRPSALAPGDSRILRVAYPKEAQDELTQAMHLMAVFGAIGGRSRNGWGSLWIEEAADGKPGDPLIDAGFFVANNQPARQWLRPFAQDWRAALARDWCHAVGRDDKGLLLWRTEKKDNWEEIIEILAKTKMDFRTTEGFRFKGKGPHSALCQRQILAYPVTKHPLNGWGNQMRSANQILFKVLPWENKYVGLVVHLPHGLPEPLKQKLSDDDQRKLPNMEKKVWAEVHRILDDTLTRLP